MTALFPCCGKLPARPRDRKAKRGQRAAEMIGKRRLKIRAVGKPQPPGMKMKPRGDAVADMRRRPAIFAVPDNGVAGMGHMNAKLVRTAGTRAKRDKRHPHPCRINEA